MSPQDAELKQLLDQFVPVRITNFKGIDLNRFRFDYDLTFVVLMMDADGRIYSRFGTNDAHHSPHLMSVPGLKQSMKDVLAWHRSSRPKPALPVALPRTAADFPAFRKLKMSQEACYHCHYANNARFAQARYDGVFRKEMVFQYPHPENLGITLETDANNVVRQVQPGSPAAKAGLRSGDVLRQAETTPVITGADLQFVLNDVPDPGKVKLVAARGGKELPALVLDLPRGWRRSDVSWRPSQEGAGPSMGFWGQPLPAAEKAKLGIAADRLAIRANFMFPGPVWARTRGDLRNGDVIIGLDGKEPPEMTTRQFHSHFRLSYDVGQKVRVLVLRGGQKTEFEVPCLEPPAE